MRLIDADELREYWLYNGLNEKIYDTNDVLESIDAAPTIDPESLRPTAEWIEAPDEGADGSWEACSSCAWESRWAASQYKYCPHCGKRMVNADD